MRPKEPTGEKKKRRTIGLSTAGVILVLAISASLLGGWAFADVVQTTNILEQGASYSISSQATANFPNPPTAQISTVPSGVSGCTGSTYNYPADTVHGGVNSVYVSGGNSCQPGSFAELIEFVSGATLQTETVQLTVFTSLGNGTAYSSTINLVTITNIPENLAQLWVYISYSTNGPPVSGIAGVSIVMA